METRDGSDRAGIPLLALGFRPFFLLGGLFSIAATLRWIALYHWPGDAGPAQAVAWHSHEMVFGYGAAVVTGFLLTAVRNWISAATLNGPGLAVLALLWALPRVFGLASGDLAVPWLAAADLAFLAGAAVAIGAPLVRAGARRQYLLLALMALMWIGNACWWWGVIGARPAVAVLGIDIGLYVLVALVMLLGRRVVPSFIERGMERPLKLVNRPWLDRAVPAVYLGYCVFDLTGIAAVAGTLSAALAVLYGVRLHDWHDRGIWSRPMLWVLYLATAFLGLGFLMQSLASFALVPAFAATHAMAYGGIGLMTLGMMARVSLGHTGRPVQPPPAGIGAAFATLACGALARVLGPLLVPEIYPAWIGLAQVLWAIAFGIFAWRYLPILLRPRIDGQPG